MNVDVEVVGLLVLIIGSFVHPVWRFAQMSARLKRLEEDKAEIVTSLHGAIDKFEKMIAEQQKYCSNRSIEYGKLEQEMHQQRLLLMEVRQDVRGLRCTTHKD